MKHFPQHKVPKLGDEGETYRQHQLAYQLPKQDLSLKYCQHVGPRDKSSFQDFICARNDIALDIGHVICVQAPNKKEENKIAPNCNKCQKELNNGELAVVAPRFGLKTLWHPTCFTCTTCSEPLVKKNSLNSNKP